MLRTVSTFGQPRSAKGERTKEDVTDNGYKKIVKWPVRFVKLSYNEWPVNEHELDCNKLVEITVLQLFPHQDKSWQTEISFALPKKRNNEYVLLLGASIRVLWSV